jgi:hypothetical protein
MYTFQALQIFIFLIPGFISSKLLDILVIRRQDQKELNGIIEALILSMVIYTLYSLTGLSNPIILNQANNTKAYNYDPKSFLLLTGASVLLPLFFAIIINNDLHMKLARALKITKKTARLSVWHDTFYEKTPRVILDFADGRRLFGWAEHFSDDPDKPYIYIAQPQWIKGKKYIKTDLNGILITPEQKIAFIEFLKDNQEEKKGKQNGTRSKATGKSEKA